MIRSILAAALLCVPVAAQAQQAHPMHTPSMGHGAAAMAEGAARAVRPKEPGQSAFAAIQEIVSILGADPNTDWSKVDIDGLRRHLVDMSNVTLYAHAAARPVGKGMRYTVTGKGAVRASIRRMVAAHAKTMNGRNGWGFAAGTHPEGAVLTVTVSSPADLAKLSGLGFFGLMAYGMHHQDHHLMIATGKAPHP